MDLGRNHQWVPLPLGQRPLGIGYALSLKASPTNYFLIIKRKISFTNGETWRTPPYPND